MYQQEYGQPDNLGQPQMQAEFPAMGTALNPVEEAWIFDPNAAAAPVDKLAESMQQGE